MGRYETAAEHKPDYLRVSQAERERAAKEKNAAPEIRRMVMEDGAAIAELEYSLFRDAWSEKSILETLKQPNAICLIAEKADRTAGYPVSYTHLDVYKRQLLHRSAVTLDLEVFHLFSAVFLNI